MDDRGKVKLSMKRVNQETGEVGELPDPSEMESRPPRRENRDRGPRREGGGRR
jgi:polyribonucleotide nucleotidyltransferase